MSSAVRAPREAWRLIVSNRIPPVSFRVVALKQTMQGTYKYVRKTIKNTIYSWSIYPVYKERAVFWIARCGACSTHRQWILHDWLTSPSHWRWWRGLRTQKIFKICYLSFIVDLHRRIAHRQSVWHCNKLPHSKLTFIPKSVRVSRKLCIGVHTVVVFHWVALLSEDDLGRVDHSVAKRTRVNHFEFESTCTTT